MSLAKVNMSQCEMCPLGLVCMMEGVLQRNGIYPVPFFCVGCKKYYIEIRGSQKHSFYRALPPKLGQFSSGSVEMPCARGPLIKNDICEECYAAGRGKRI